MWECLFVVLGPVLKTGQTGFKKSGLFHLNNKHSFDEKDKKYFVAYYFIG